METGALRPYGTIAHDPPMRRDDVAGSPNVTDLPTEKTVRAAQAGSEAGSAGNDTSRQDPPAVRTGFERDPSSGSIVYRWVEQATDRVIVEIPKAVRARSSQAYADGSAPAETSSHRVDRKV